MDDSDHDFVDLCSKLLKRVRKKAGEAGRRAEQQSCSQAADGHQRSRAHHHGDGRGSKLAATQPELDVVCAEAGSSAVPSAVTSDKDVRAKDKVLHRMQQFKRAGPQKMAHRDGIQPINQVHGSPAAGHQRSDAPSHPSADPPSEPLNADEALALRLQQELDREAAEAQSAGLEDGSLFFCQICHRDLSHMTPEGRTQHLNRCLDESEQSGPAPPPPSRTPDCPICGKKFKSQKSRSAHLKRCSSEMGVAPTVLLQALQRQAEESHGSASNTLVQTVGTKRKGAAKSGLPVRKKPKKKTEPLDEETMVALALSSSMLEQKEADAASSHSSITPALHWRADAGKGRGSRRKAAIPRPPPLLLVQDAEAALTRLQERVAALLLHGRAPSPPTPTLSPSTLPRRAGVAPLWLKSAVLDGGFYAAELQEFFTPSQSVTMEPASFRASNKSAPPPTVQPVGGGAWLSCSQTASCSSAPSTPGTGQLPVGSQALRDLMELAEDGMTLTQYGYSAKDKRVSGFIQEESEEQAELCVSGFLLETTHKPPKPPRHPAARATDRPGADGDRNLQSVALSRLASDLRSMVNNPQLSDVQLQVDSGEVYFGHSFMVYARCPLLAEMVHESGFGVQEEGMPAAQRVLLSDVPGQAVLVLLQYLYTGQCSITASLRPPVLELASRFDLQELEQLCRVHREEAGSLGDEAESSNQEENPSEQTDQAFMELLRSMWNEEDDSRMDSDGGGDEGDGGEEDRSANEAAASDGEICEERVNEEELEEIYEFAATQKKREERGEEEEDGDAEFTKLRESKKHLQPDSNYSRLFSQSWGSYEEEDAPSVSDPSPRLPARTPPAMKSSLPAVGLSPGPVGDGGRGGHNREEALKRESQGPRSIFIPPSPDLHTKKEEPELIVLSDSSEEMEVGGAYTERRSINDAVTLEKDETGNLEWSPGDAPDCSPEVSWLIPSTPVQPGRTTTCSTQTRSSICRTTLFPRGFSPPASPLNASSRPHRDLVISGSGSPPRRSSSDPSPSNRSRSSSFTPLHSLQASTNQDAPLLPLPQPYSSTPFHTELRQLPLLPAASPLHTGTDQQDSSGRRRGRTPPESFHFSPPSSPSVSSHSRRRDSERRRESGGGGGGGGVLKRKEAGNRREESEVGCNDGEQGEGGMEEADVGQSSFQNSFMDEPPIAFNDSWGLDACGGADPGCFSLRLEDSTGSRGTSPRPPEPAASSSPPHPDTRTTPEVDNGLLDSRIWDSWGEDGGEEGLPLSQRLHPSPLHKTPVTQNKKRRSLVPITPMPPYSDLDTPELKNKLNRFGVRPLPKRQMILKLKEIHQYTHQLASSDSEGETGGGAAPTKPPAGRPPSCAQRERFKEPRAPVKPGREEDAPPLSASQSSNTSSTAASEESERSNPELVISSDGDSDSDGGISSSQAASRLKDSLQAVRAFILSDSKLYNQILQYRPLVLSQLQEQLKAAGIRLAAAKLVDYLDSQSITFTTAKPGHAAPGRRRGHKPGKRPGKTAQAGGRKKTAAML